MSDDRPVPLRRRDIMTVRQLFWLSFSAALFAGLVALMSMGFFEEREAGYRMRILVITLIATVSTFLGTALVIGLLLMMIHPEEITQVIDKPTLIQEDTVVAELKAQRAATDAAKAAARAQRGGTSAGGGGAAGANAAGRDAAPHS